MLQLIRDGTFNLLFAISMIYGSEQIQVTLNEAISVFTTHNGRIHKQAKEEFWHQIRILTCLWTQHQLFEKLLQA